LNKAVAGKTIDDAAQVRVFKCDLGWNGVGGLEDAIKYMDKHKLEKIAVWDRYPRQVTREQF